MSCFSTVTIHRAWLPEELQSVGAWQTKDLPEDEETMFPNDDYYDGTIRHDGVFVREDGMWNPSLSGWAELVSDLCYAHHEICIRFECGVLAELIVGGEPPGELANSVRGWSPRTQ
jgi:hypothetical protein